MQVFALGPIEWDMGPFGLIFFARDFLGAARAVPLSQGFSPTRYYLVCHSIELSLKAFLALKGQPLLTLMDKHRHRLAPALEEGVEAGLLALANLTTEQQTEIRRASEAYNSKLFEYPSLMHAATGYSGMLPNADTLLAAAEVLVDGLFLPCRDAALA